jgi:hypothetical protein
MRVRTLAAMAEVFSGESTRGFSLTEEEAVGRITHNVANWPSDRFFLAETATMTVAFRCWRSASCLAVKAGNDFEDEAT